MQLKRAQTESLCHYYFVALSMKAAMLSCRCDAVLVLQIHHVARVVVLERQVLLEIGRQAEVRPS